MLRIFLTTSVVLITISLGVMILRRRAQNILLAKVLCLKCIVFTSNIAATFFVMKAHSMQLLSLISVTYLCLAAVAGVGIILRVSRFGGSTSFDKETQLRS